MSGRGATAPQNSIQAGDRVLLARRVNSKIAITEANVVARAEKDGRPVIRLQSVERQPVIGGDSGGGVWQNGRLAGVMWTTIQMENQSSGARRTTDQSIAAVYEGYPG